MRHPVVHVRFGSGRLVLGARWSENGVSRARKAPAPAERPGDFLKRHLEYELTGQYGRSWDELHPAHQRVVSRDRYVERRSKLLDRDGVPGGFESFEVLDVHDEPIECPGIPETVSKAVKVGFSLQGRRGTQTLHAIQIGSRWCWFLRADALREYREGDSAR
jgi:hypothetical protein